MPDDLQIPLPSPPQSVGRPSYRIDRQRAGLDPSTRRLLAFAGGALALVVVAGGAWTIAARRPAGVPVIEADSRPLRVKPDNPGGMQVAGADEPDDAAPTLAPAPEAPAPLALRAQVQANRPAPPATSPVAATPGSNAPGSNVPGPNASGTEAPGVVAAVTPAPPVASARPAAPSQVPATVAGKPPGRVATGTAQVQLAAMDSEDAARSEWARLQRKLPDLLGARQLAVQRADKDGKAVWRVRTGGFADLADAAGFCAKVRAKGADCSLGTY